MSSSVSIHGPSGRGGVEALGAGPLQVRLLDVAGGEVVAAGVAEDHVVDALLRDVLADPADDDAQLGLEGDFLGELRQDDRDRWARPRRCWASGTAAAAAGTSLPSSRACSTKLRPTPITLLRGMIGASRRTSSSLCLHGGPFHAVEERVALDDSDFLTAGLAFNNAVEGIRIDYKPGDTHGSIAYSLDRSLCRRQRAGSPAGPPRRVLGGAPDGRVDVGVHGVRHRADGGVPRQPSRAARICASRSVPVVRGRRGRRRPVPAAPGRGPAAPWPAPRRSSRSSDVKIVAARCRRGSPGRWFPAQDGVAGQHRAGGPSCGRWKHTESEVWPGVASTLDVDTPAARMVSPSCSGGAAVAVRGVRGPDRGAREFRRPRRAARCGPRAGA